MSARQNDGQNDRREPVDNCGQIGEVLALPALWLPLRPAKIPAAARASGNPALEAPAMPFPRASKALTRFTVLDLTRVRSGPTCVRQLADWGANVIKIETPPGLEEPMGGPREGGDFQNLHRNKRSMTLNLKAPEGLAAFKRMVKKADVVVENFRPDVKKRLGIDYKTLAKINPRIVYASISGFGQDGPYAGRPGFDQIAQGMGGLMSVTGLPGQGPVRVGIPVADLSAGLLAATGILVALLEREKSKKGQQVATSLLQAQIFMLDFQAARYLVQGEVAKQAGNNHPTSAPTGVYKTDDGYINIATAGQTIWKRFCEAIEAPELAKNPDYIDGAARSKNRDALDVDINKRLVGRTSAEWIERLNDAGCPCGPIYSIDKMFADPQVQHLGIAQSVTKKDKSKMRLVGQGVTLSRTPSKLVVRPPELGEHTDAVLKEFGFSKRDIAALHKAKAV
jgi:crotonobetainyl-CoA:carnitine CoA-transferase CaiB-like acyl-CoA transferase